MGSSSFHSRKPNGQVWPGLESILDLRYGRDPYLDAWILHFLSENNLDHRLSPERNASLEQLRFMVDLDADQLFAPCPDEELMQLLQDGMPDSLQEAYNRQWRRMAGFVHTHVQDRTLWRRIVALCRYKFRLVRSSPFLIPARLMKRFVTIFLTQTAIDDPLREEKMARNRRAQDFLQDQSMQVWLQACPEDLQVCATLDELRWRLDQEELRRLLCLVTWEPIWDTSRDPDRALREEKAWTWASQVPEIMHQALGPDRGQQKILYLPEQSGGILFDLRVIQSLLRQGHRVILALKDGFSFTAPTMWDTERDPVLAEALKGAVFIHEDQIDKNTLLRKQRENPFLVISDGTRERLNLYRTSLTFARSWKESDLIIAIGRDHHRQLIANSHSFTRDILCCCRNENNELQAVFKPKSPRITQFTENQLLRQAEAIIETLRQAKGEGKKVMFYSAIIGSIPGQTKTAIQVLKTFVAHLRVRLVNTMIVNPAEHFQSGMDGDDLMYMWERVQRSGLIDVWRFQTVEDIEKSFELMGQKMPPVWIGKDSTFSTGCTKEMHIALDMQKIYPELQIIGPPPERFFRRREYGVGKFFDVRITDNAGGQ